MAQRPAIDPKGPGKCPKTVVGSAQAEAGRPTRRLIQQHRVVDPRLETGDIYKVTKLKLIRRGEEQAATEPRH